MKYSPWFFAQAFAYCLVEVLYLIFTFKRTGITFDQFRDL